MSSEAGPSRFPTVSGGAALPLTFTPRNQTVLVIGSNRLAATRAFTFLEADATVLLSSSQPEENLHPELQHRISAGQIQYTLSPSIDDPIDWKRFLIENEISLIAVTDTLIGASPRRSFESASAISQLARSLRIPINVSDLPIISTYTFPSTHRFLGEDGRPSSLQIAVSTNGHGCRLGGRIKRDIITRLPKSVGAAVENVGRLRARAATMDKDRRMKAAVVSEDDVDTPLNTPVPQLTVKENPMENFDLKNLDRDGEEEEEAQETQLRRMRWVHQMSEYYSYDALAKMKQEEMDHALATYSNGQNLLNGNHTGQLPSFEDSSHSLSTMPARLPHHESLSGSTAVLPSKGRIYLVGSGPGHPGLLTVAAHHILKTATLILSDKLVPSEILALIPKSTTLHIAKKFPGNAEGAQNEMMELALQGAQAGEIVVRLKQGDPFVYGRGGEEVLFFRKYGFECTVVPGISSALAGPLMMGIPVTQRGVAESLVMCTGVGRMGKAVKLPGYVKSRSLIVLMGVARIASIVDVLTNPIASGRDGKVFPRHLPIAVIERASSPDQRVILSTLDKIQAAIESMEERPPGMMVIGWSALCLEGSGRVDILDGGSDEDNEREIVKQWLGDKDWKVREGFSAEWEELLTSIEA